jgi:hypothetical protein
MCQAVSDPPPFPHALVAAHDVRPAAPGDFWTAYDTQAKLRDTSL